MKKVCSYFRKRRYKNSLGMRFVRFVYSIGIKKWIHSIIIAVLSIIIPFTISNNYTKTSIALFALLFLDILLDYVCAEYQKTVFVERQFSEQMIKNQSSLMNSVALEIQHNENWRKSIFKKTSEMVCGKIYNIFKYVLNCETRVSIEYVFDAVNKNKEKERRVKMAGRKSQTRETCRKSQKLSSKRNYFSYKVFSKEKQNSINILQKAQIEDQNIWYKNKEHDTKVNQYFGIAISVRKEDEIDFILQIDCLGNLSLGDNTDTLEGLKDFINQYLMFYVHIITLAYCLNLNKNNEIGDV